MTKLHKMDTPVFWAEGHPGRLQRDTWKISISGLCLNPFDITWKDLLKMPVDTVNARLTSVTRWSVYGQWSGVRVSRILEMAKADKEVNFVRFWSVGQIYDTSISLEVANLDKTILAYAFDDEYLDEDYGGPVRVFCPYLWGYKSAKSIVKIELMKDYRKGYWERRGYTDHAEIEEGEIFDINSGRVRRIPGGEVKDFLDE